MKKLIDLITDAGTGQISHTKIWTNIAYAVFTYAILSMVVSQNPPSIEMWLLYLGIVGGHNLLSKAVSMKYKKAGE